MTLKPGSATGGPDEAERLAARVAELEADTAELRTVMALAAHEVQTSLSMVQVYGDMLSDGEEARSLSEVQRDLDALMLSASRTQQLVHLVLQDFADQAEAGVRERVDLGVVLDDCLASLAPEVRARQARIEVDPLPTVPGEPALLRALISNLVTNALKYGADRAPAVRIRATRGEGCWTLWVDSDGHTIPAEDRERIFDAGRSAPARPRGNGLGLTLSRWIVERHGGRIGVLPGSRKGNRFFFTLPADA
jgi:signal transduction histidine kinase